MERMHGEDGANRVIGGARRTAQGPAGQAGVAIMLVLLGACARPTHTEPSPPSPEVTVAGSVLAIDDFGRHLSVYDVVSRIPTELTIPNDASAVLDAFWAGDRILALLRMRTGETRLFEVGPGRQPEQVGPATVSLGTFAHAPGIYMGTECLLGRVGGGAIGRGAGIYTIDLAEPARWRRIADGCAATLSPDGRWVAYTDDARTIWRQAADGSGSPERLLEIASVAGLPADDREVALIAGPPEWSEAGLAFSLAIDDRLAVGTLRSDGTATAWPLGDNGLGLAPGLAWQPNGAFLAATSASHVEGILRLLDSSVEEWRVIGLESEPYLGILWAPDGGVLLASARSQWDLVDPTVGRIGTVVSGRAIPVDWKA